MDTRPKTDDTTIFAGEFGRPDYGATPTSEQAPSIFQEKEKSRWCPPARRHYVALMAFLGFCNVYALRVDLSVAVIDMIKNHTIRFANGTVIEVGGVKLKLLLNLHRNTMQRVSRRSFLTKQ